MSRRLAALAAALTATGALVLAGCGYDPGPAGKVVGKEKEYECSGTGKKRSCHWEYELTTQDEDGQQHEFEVSGSDYDNCYQGSAYPKCTGIDR